MISLQNNTLYGMINVISLVSVVVDGQCILNISEEAQRIVILSSVHPWIRIQLQSVIQLIPSQNIISHDVDFITILSVDFVFFK